jgi:hypothetical protein
MAPIVGETTKAAGGPAPAPDMVWIPAGTFVMASDSHYLREAPASRASWSSGCFVRLVESGEASDAIADHDNSDHEQNHGHDRHIVLHQPFP